ncbi:histidine phosphatase family protein [Ponticaulis profundi]|uniref:Histidine phosphatase family protein n=1 Tax=Ponticaulis profundi TaxID=2665222 RepID=A0ABW1SAU1_9PROT
MTMQIMPDRTWYFVRHGETEWNAEKRMQGQWESNLNENGKRHADENGRWLKDLGIGHIWASPQSRVRQTAEIISQHMPLAANPTFDDRLKEWSSGDWSGELYADLAVKRPEEWAAWEADRYGYRPPNGENFVDLEERADSFFADSVSNPEPTVAVFAHGFIIRVMVGRLAGLSVEEVLAVKQTNQTVIRVQQRDGQCRIDHFVAGVGPFEGLPRGEQGAA